MQNSSPNQMMMLTTRIGVNSKMVITGDLKQTDKGNNSGLSDFVDRFELYKKYDINAQKNDSDNKNIEVIYLGKSDIERNPIATSFSIYRTLFAHGSLDFSYSQDDIISFYDLYKSFMIFWDAHLPNLICHVNYERLVKNPRDEFALIFNYLNLPFDEKVLELQANKRSVLTASDLQIRKTIYDGSSNSWVKYEGEIQKFTQAFKT
jgi:hypothetical protein